MRGDTDIRCNKSMICAYISKRQNSTKSLTFYQYLNTHTLQLSCHKIVTQQLFTYFHGMIILTKAGLYGKENC